MKRFHPRGASARRALFCIFLLTAVPAAAGGSVGQKNRFTDRDKARVVQSVLSKQDLPARRPRTNEVKGVIYLSTENLPPSLRPRVRGVRLILLPPDEIERRSETGFGHLAFKEFRGGGRKVTVTLWDAWRNTSRGAGDVRKVTYEYRKVKNRWVGRQVSEAFSVR